MECDWLQPFGISISDVKRHGQTPLVMAACISQRKSPGLCIQGHSRVRGLGASAAPGAQPTAAKVVCN